MGHSVSSDVQQLDHVQVIPSSMASYCHIPGFSVFTLKDILITPEQPN